MTTVKDILDEPLMTHWGRWSVLDGALWIESYAIPIADVLGSPWHWVSHMAGKGWISDRDVRDLVEAIETLTAEHS